MSFAEKLKELRSGAGLSQEKLAEQLGVSRQVVTKWETGRSTPDMQNLLALSDVFSISLDEMLGEVSAPQPQEESGSNYLYESVTEYDVAEVKRFDVKLGGFHALTVRGCDSEKLKVRLLSSVLPDLASDFKVRIDDVRSRLDVEMSRRPGVSETAARQGLDLILELPRKYAGHIEIKAAAALITVTDLVCEDLELDGKLHELLIDGFSGCLELDSNQDLLIDCRSLQGSLELNQMSAVSRLQVGRDAAFAVRCRGLGNAVYYEQGSAAAEDFSVPEAESIIELNGLKNELVICRQD